MRFPVVWNVGGAEIAAHGVLEWSGYALAALVFRALRRRTGDVVSSDARWITIAAAAGGAMLGSRLVAWLDDPPDAWAHAGDLAWLLGARTVVGGFLGGWAAVEVAKRRLGVTARTGDLWAVPLCAGLALGRVGCFLGGLPDRTHGVASSLPWAVDFGDGVPRHPAQLYESLFALVLGAVCLRATLRPHAQGSVFRLFLASYLAWRLGIDFLKPRPFAWAGLSGIQWTCVAGLAALVAARSRPAPPAAGVPPRA